MIGKYIVKLYVDMIRKGETTIENVPKKLRATVQEELNKLDMSEEG